ncbi:MAG: HEAT repeat domain-containing protein, partial [Spirochaetota bacterium]|nr:HEAT repeat domain-containing protein [Spirochaetota bacterium]
DGHLINDFPVIRSRAVDILGITGSLQTIEFLVDILNYEWDDYVINSIIRSLGNLQSDKNDIITNGISNYCSTNENNSSQRYLHQVLFTVKKLKSYNGTTNIKLLELITQIFLKSSSRITKELALDTINSLKK